MRKLLTVIFLLLFIFPVSAFAKDSQTNCDNRFVTVVNPVRSRDLWRDKSLKPLTDQYQAVSQNNLSATWLLQYDGLLDSEMISTIKGFNQNQEKGVFLEVSSKLANDSRVIYPYDAPWFSPRAVFLSAYSQSDRRRLIDTLFQGFKSQFGFYPKSVGAWWIDSYSLDYMQQKYGITVAMIVADQRTTDSYGVWGQWWGVPFYPSKANILTPASNLDNKLDVAIIQWAQRDLSLAYGGGPSSSNYSLQGNDYIRQGKNTDYFKELASRYLDCANPLGQITVGLETGIEGADYLSEYQNQMRVLSNWSNLKSVTMSQFAQNFARVYPSFPRDVTLSDDLSEWKMAYDGRSNQYLGDAVTYFPKISFSDYFIPDKSNFLERDLSKYNHSINEFYWPVYLLILASLAVFFRKRLNVYLISLIFTWLCFGLILRSTHQLGWLVFYGPSLNPLWLFQCVAVLISFGIALLISKYKKEFLPFIFLSFGFDFLIEFIRYSFISGQRIIGFSIDSLRLVGLSFGKHISFVNQDLPSYQAAALLKLDFNKIWSHPLQTFVVYPAMHIFISFLIFIFLMRVNRVVRCTLIWVLVLLAFFYGVSILTTDPQSVLAVG